MEQQGRNQSTIIPEQSGLPREGHRSDPAPSWENRKQPRVYKSQNRSNPAQPRANRNQHNKNRNRSHANREQRRSNQTQRRVNREQRRANQTQRRVNREQRRANRELRREIKKERRHLARFQTTGQRRRRWYRWMAGAGAILVLLWLLIPPFLHPLRGPVTSGFFLRGRPESSLALSLEIHEGIDIAAPGGTAVRAAKSGVVRHAGWSDTLGNWVQVDHWLGFSTRYGHMESLSVEAGDWVFKGLSGIGRVGSTGRSTGNHLHFEVRWFDRPLPPGVFLLFSELRWRLLGF
ncbi:M23 family metallopeptidase [Spirochaeta lutea]|uniref:M23 family metallopeptidase n=1 Tax=Spirochaeta lutea TaxID=1480694 RepID=UPI00068EACF4|nr:M23 family metallopeptidase [Spirochaeta lutea]